MNRWNKEDLELIERAKAGDTEALKTLRRLVRKRWWDRLNNQRRRRMHHRVHKFVHPR